MAAAQSPAAVVRPLTRLSRVTMIVPAPMKPMPEMTCAPRRATSVNRCRESSRYWLVSVVMAAPRQMRMCVRKPAGRRSGLTAGETYADWPFVLERRGSGWHVVSSGY